MSEFATVSIVLTVYNTQNYLLTTLQSLVKQIVPPDEIIIVNDGSQDSSLEICEKFKGLLPNVKIVSQKNKGPGAARNVGLALCSSEYVLFLDDDDVFSEHLISKLKQVAYQFSPDVVCFASKEFSNFMPLRISVPWYVNKKNLPLNKKCFHPKEVAGSPFNTFIGWAWDKLFRREFIVSHGLNFPLIRNSEDLVFTYPALALAEKISYLDEVLVFHRANRPGSVSTTLISRQEDFYTAIRLAKNRLKKNPDLWAWCKQDYLNWAVHFTLWIAYFLGNRNVQNRLLKGELEELELDKHSIEYYYQYPLDVILLKNIQRWDCTSFKVYFFWKRFFYSLTHNGIRYTVYKILLRIAFIWSRLRGVNRKH